MARSAAALWVNVVENGRQLVGVACDSDQEAFRKLAATARNTQTWIIPAGMTKLAADHADTLVVEFHFDLVYRKDHSRLLMRAKVRMAPVEIERQTHPGDR